MTGWMRAATFVAVAAILAMTTGGAGARSSPAGATKASSSAATRSAASMLAARREALLRHANLTTLAGAKRYLRAIGIDPRGVVIQRGPRNYAGPSCPGGGWTCTSTVHPVVQVAAAGGENTFMCSTASCAVVQVAAPAAKPSKASCVRTTGLGASCSISQSSASMDNIAAIYEDAGKLTGLTQTASYTASITQNATGATNSNQACVHQVVLIDGSTNLSGKKSSISVMLEAHQSVTISQDALGGTNSARDEATSSGECMTNPTTNPLLQSQTLTSTVVGSGSVIQNENAGNNGANMSLDIEQNQGAGNGTATGPNNAVFKQTNTLGAVANSPVAVSQTQSSVNGGILAKVNQDSRGLSTANATQTETQCEDAATSGLTSCSTTEHTNMGPSSLTQTQYGPVKKTPGDSSQTGNESCSPPTCDSFIVTQTSQQDSDSGSTQTNVVSGGFSTSGSGTVTQTTTENGSTTTHAAAGSTVDTSTTCTGGSCATTTPSGFVRGDVLVSIGNGLVEERSPSGALVRTLDTGKGNGIFTTGLALDANKNLYVTDFNGQDVTKLLSDGTASSFGSGYNLDPESIVFDSAGNAYVGQADGAADVLKFSSTGTLVASYDAAVEDRGTDWIDLASDGCTLYYTSEGPSVKRFNVCTNTQLTDFATGLPGPGEAFAIKLLPGGGALVANADSIVRLDNAGAVVQQYGPGETQSGGGWFALALDPDGTSFWAGDGTIGKVTRFSLSSGNALASFTTGGTQQFGKAEGIVVVP